MLLWEIILLQSTSVLSPGKFHGHGSLMGYSPWGSKESDTTERLTLHLCVKKKNNVKICIIENLVTNYSFSSGFNGDSAGKESACIAGDLGLILGLWRSPGEGNATHSSILAWRIPWTLQFMGSQRVGHI